MKTAFVHDWIITIWWAENVLKELIKKEEYKNPKIFTLFSDKKYLKIEKEKIPIDALISNNFLINKIWYRNLLPFFPILTFFLSLKIRKYKPQKTIISSFAISKNIKTKWYKKLYLHSPMQYIRESYDEYCQKLSWLKKIVFKLSSFYLKKWDRKQRNFDEVLFNSQYTQKTAQKIYNLSGEIAYPPISSHFLNANYSKDIDNYFVYMWRLVKFSKEVDKIINLFNKNWENLIIIWEWPDEVELKKQAKDNIIFTWKISENKEKEKILKSSRWFVNLTKESFWIATAEALCCWVPIFGYEKGGSWELVDKNSGILVQTKDIKTLNKKFNEFKEKVFDRKKIKNNFLEIYKKYCI